MLVDLERNDLGRICRGGTVQVDEFMTIESYATVHHIVSNVRGELRPGVTPGEAVLVDDNQGNVDSALSLGMHAILYKDNEGVFTQLARLTKSDPKT